MKELGPYWSLVTNGTCISCVAVTDQMLHVTEYGTNHLCSLSPFTERKRERENKWHTKHLTVIHLGLSSVLLLLKTQWDLINCPSFDSPIANFLWMRKSPHPHPFFSPFSLHLWSVGQFMFVLYYSHVTCFIQIRGPVDRLRDDLAHTPQIVLGQTVLSFNRNCIRSSWVTSTWSQYFIILLNPSWKTPWLHLAQSFAHFLLLHTKCKWKVHPKSNLCGCHVNHWVLFLFYSSLFIPFLPHFTSDSQN